jgi:hypothetical protein
LIDYYEPEVDVFMINGQSLKIETEDIYFLMGLSCQGDIVNLKGKGSIGLIINEYIVIYCSTETEKVGSQLPIKHLESLNLKIIFLMIVQIFISASLHQDSRMMMFYAIKFLRPIIYDWSTSLLMFMKAQLIG